MENHDVIREIDALIDSYNWPEITQEPDKIVTSLKQVLRDGKTSIYWLHTEQNAAFVLFQLFIRILQHPRVRNKGWAIEMLPYVSYVSHAELATPLGRQRYRALQEATPLLRRYMTHHRPSYRLHAALTLSRLVHQPDEVVKWLLDLMRREHSYQVVTKIFRRLAELLTDRHAALIQPETRARVVAYLERRLKDKHPTLKIHAAITLIRILQKKTSPCVLNVILENWPFLNVSKRTHWRILYSLRQWMYVLVD